MRIADAPDILDVSDMLAIGDSKIGRDSLYSALRAGELPARRVGNKYVVLKTKFVAWLAGEDNQGDESGPVFEAALVDPNNVNPNFDIGQVS